MEDDFLKEIKEEFCNHCIHKNECHTPCPNVIRKILGIGDECEDV